MKMTIFSRFTVVLCPTLSKYLYNSSVAKSNRERELRDYFFNKKAHGPLPIDELLILFLILYFVFGYSLYDSFIITWKVTYWGTALIVAPIFLFLFLYLSFSDTPVGGPREQWWLPHVKQKRTGVTYFNGAQASPLVRDTYDFD